MSKPLEGRSLIMSGGSRGIGLSIALAAARLGANITLLAKTADPNPKLPGTIYSAAAEIEEAGGQALPIVGDVRDEASVQNAVDQAVAKFGGIDIMVNNASAIRFGAIDELFDDCPAPDPADPTDPTDPTDPFHELPLRHHQPSRLHRRPRGGVALPTGLHSPRSPAAPGPRPDGPEHGHGLGLLHTGAPEPAVAAADPRRLHCPHAGRLPGRPS